MSDAATLTERDFIEIGLETAKVVGWRLCKPATAIERFKQFYLATPATCVAIWDDLKKAGAISKKDKPVHLLVGLRFLLKYENESNLAHFFGFRSRTTAAKYARLWVGHISTLFAGKVSFVDTHLHTFAGNFLTISIFSILLRWAN